MSRETRQDPVAGKRMTRAVILFAVAMLGVGGSIAWVIATGSGGRANDTASLGACCFVLFVLAAVVNVFFAYGRMMWFHRCPRCTARTERLGNPNVSGPIRYRCPACDIEWDTGWNRAPGGGD